MTSERAQVAREVRRIVATTLGLDPFDVTELDRVQDDLGADALDVEMIREDLEVQFEIEIPDEELHKCATVGDLVDLVAKMAQLVLRSALLRRVPKEAGRA